MSNCDCGFDVGDPRVTRHSSHCSSIRLPHLEERVKELYAENQRLRESIHGLAVAGEGLIGHIKKLEDAIAIHKRGIEMRYGATPMPSPEDISLWMLLQEQGE